MKIEPAAFQTAFLRRAEGANQTGRADRALAERSAEPADSVELTPAHAEVPTTPLQQAVLALSAASAAVGGPLLPAVAQEVGKALVTAAQEERQAESRREAFGKWVVPTGEKAERVREAWERLQQVSPSPLPPPKVIDLSLTFAESDTREMFIGTRALDGELADPSVLTFTLAHEEGHRRHRDSAGSAGLEALVAAVDGAPAEVTREAFRALREGRHENERRADAFAAEVAARLGCDPEPILAFLLACEEDMQHPAGLERAEAVRDRMASLGRPLDDARWQALLAERG